MSVLQESSDLAAMAARRGVDVIGAAQRTIAYTVVAAGENGALRITLAAHGLKKGQSVRVNTSGAVAGYIANYRVTKVVSTTVIDIYNPAITFSATSTGNITLTGALDGIGFFVTTSPTISEFVPQNPSVDGAAVIARVFAAGESFDVPFKSITITAGNISVVRAPIRARLAYTRRVS